MKDIKIIAFDADDTLWVNETYFLEVEEKFCELLKDYLPSDEVSKELFKTEIKNIEIYGYGVKAYILSMIETLIRITKNNASSDLVNQVIELGKEQLNKPIELIDGVEEVLKALYNKYILILATKGDLLDQENKLKKSGLGKYFRHVEIMSEKKKENYENLIKKINCDPKNFLMLGNSPKSDILPVIELGGNAIHIPFKTTWAHEELSDKDNVEFLKLKSISHVLEYLE